MAASIYKLSSDFTDLVYVGSTIEGLNRRKSKHKTLFKRYNDGKAGYCGAFAIVRLGDFKMELLEECNVDEKSEREQHWLEEMRNIYGDKLVNVFRAVKDPEYSKEYYEKNKEAIRTQQADYLKNNKETIKEQIKSRNSKIYKCVCGSEIRKGSKAAHEKSKKHQNYINNMNNNRGTINITNNYYCGHTPDQSPETE